MVEVIEKQISGTDVVAEIGAQLRFVSQAIANQSVRSVHVDVRRRFPSNTEAPHRTKAMRRPGDEKQFAQKFFEMESLDDWCSVFLREKDQYTVLVLDVNAIVGNDLPWTSLQLVRQFVALHPSCTTVIIKSVTLHQWASRLVHARRFVQEEGKSSNLLVPQIVVAVGVSQYRQTIEFAVHADDMALELGCHSGVTTSLLREKAAHTIGVDVGSKIIKSAKKKYPSVHFAVGDAYRTAGLLRIQQEYYNLVQDSLAPKGFGFDVVYVDVGGLSGSDGLLEALNLIDSLRFALEPRCIVIKSLCIQRLSSTLVPSWKL
jgi:hypothetical protein